MSIIGKVDSLWRYPVKSMRGEELKEAYVGFSGVYGDRLYAFRSDTRPKGFPYLTGREQAEMILYRPRFRHPDRAAMPPNLAEAEGIEPGLNPIFERDPRCAMISLDPETAMRNPDILGLVTKAHEGKAGVYGAVLVEGMLRAGDEVAVLN